MKTITEQIEAAKMAAVTAINEMEKAQADKEKLQNWLSEQVGKANPDWMDNYTKWAASCTANKKAVKNARKQVTNLATFIGVKITKPMMYDYQIKQRMYTLFDCANEIEEQITKVIDVYRQWN